jgi:EpsI family protein
MKRYWILLVILSATAVMTLAYLYPTRKAPNIKYAGKLPTEFDGWTGSDLPIEQATFQILETEDVLIRQYRRIGDPIVGLSVVFAQENRKVAHPPEVCLTGGGWEVQDKRSITLPNGLDVVRLVTTRGRMTELHYYWYKSGDLFTDSYIHQQLNIALNHIMLKRASASLLRVTTLVEGDDFNEADTRLTDFVMQLLPYVEEVLP